MIWPDPGGPHYHSYSPDQAYPSPDGAGLSAWRGAREGEGVDARRGELGLGQDSRAGTLLARCCGRHEVRLRVWRLSGRSLLMGGSASP